MFPIPLPPLRYLAAGAAALGLVLAIGFAVHSYGNGREADGRSAVQAQWDAAKARQLEDLRAAEKVERTTEQAGQAIVNKEAQDAHNEAPAVAHAAADLRSARERVQQRADQLAAASAAACPASQPASGSEATPAPGLVLADLYRGADAEAVELAGAFDEARRRGLRCERVYDDVKRAYDPMKPIDPIKPIARKP